MTGRPFTREKFESRFWSSLDRSGDCWLWTRCIHPTVGYGRLNSTHTDEVYAHRAAWALSNGPIPAGMDVCHTCDVRACCRPDHLFLGSRLDNMRDAQTKGRTSRGADRPGSRFTEADVLAIRERWAAGGVTQTALAAEYGTTSGHLSDIINRKRWAWLSTASGTS